MNKDIRVAIIGCGKAGHMHAQALRNIEECSLVSASSRSQQKADEFASAYQIKGYVDVQKMIQHEKIDVAVICTPHPNHTIAVKIMEAGAHVLIEKPLASTLKDCDAIIKASEKYNKKAGIVSQRRFFKPSQRVKQAIDDGKIGTPVLGTVSMLGWRNEAYYKSDPWRGTWKDEGGGVLVNQAPHQLDLFQWFMNDEIDELYGIWKNLNHPYIEVEDTALAIVKFKNGGVGNIIVSNSQKPGIHGKIHIHGSNGASVGVQTEGGSMFIAGVSSILEPPVNDLWSIPNETDNLEKWKKEDTAFFNTIDPVEYYIRLQNRDFILAVLNDTKPMVTVKDGRKTVEIFTAIYESTKINAPVKWPLKN
ncbi:MAG: oxidoreductase [Flavobacteriaceae bacterium]|nr:MAG: oxidoreductase [Flavobacteriaceae bacterium]